MDKKKIWILSGAVIILLLLIASLIIMNLSAPDVDEPAKVYPTANGGTISAVNKDYEKVAINDDGTSVSDALYEYKSKYGYSVQYNNKYIVDFGEKNYDFSIKNSTDTVNVVIKNLPYDESMANIQTKEEWDSLMGRILGESLEFQRTTINSMDALVGHYSLDYGNNNKSDVIFALLIGDEYIYSYMYNAAMNAPSTEASQIGAVLYTINNN